MREFIKNIKLKILLIFVLPTIGVIFFSSYYTMQKLQEYQNTKYLSNTIKFAYIATNLIKSLQKERGLSISLVKKQSKFFLNNLKKQRIKSDNLFLQFEKFLFIHEKVVNTIVAKTVIEQYGDVKDFRKKIDSHKVSIFAILNFYSRIVNSLIESTNTLDTRFINRVFFIKMRNFRELLSIGEINGKERALISFTLQEKRMNIEIKNELQKLESKSRYLKKVFFQEASVNTLIMYRKYISKSYEKRYRDIKQSIIFDNNLYIISASKWWQISTRYIDAIYQVNFEILQKLLQLKEKLKNEAYKSLSFSLIFFLILLITAYLLENIISKLLNTVTTLIQSVDKEKRTYKTLAQFSEIALYDKDKKAILNSLNTLLFQSEEFAHNWIATIEDDKIKPVVTENITISLIRQSIEDSNSLQTKLFKDINRAIKEKHYVLSLNKDISCELCKGVEIFGIFPVVIFDKVKYILIVATKSSENFDAKIIDMILKCVDILTFAFEKIDIQQKDSKLQQELMITSKVFDSHEAITIANAQGNIIKVNNAFTKITGYKPDEVIGKNPSVLKSGKHNKEFYEKMWKEIKERGYWQGEIYNKRKNGDIYPELLSISAIKDDRGVIVNFIAHFLDISDIKEAQKSLEYKAKYDQLTQLLNRQSMFEKLEEIYHQNKRVNEYSGFLFIDLDNFKFINDYYGHDVGDKVLIKTANILKSITKEDDIIARMAGDEFAFIANYLGSDKDLAIQKISILAEKMIDTFSTPLNIDNKYNINISLSIGIKIFPDEEKDHKEVVINADVAMYNAKKEGKRQLSFFNSRLDLESKEFLILKNEFEEGLKKHEFVLYYQPKVSTKDNSIAGLEALVRWYHPTKGLMFPDSFLYVTQNNKLSIDLHKYILKEVCSQIKIWQSKHKNFNLRVSVNISGEQFYNKHFVRDTLDIISKEDIDPGFLDFEILEDVFLKDKQRVISIIKQFKSKGITFSLDDFGTGYSSISSLHLLPIDNLKIDKTFVLNLFKDRNKEIVKLSIDIAKVYDIDVIAEGVEDEKSLEYIKKHGCKFYQGYYFSKAVPAEEIEKLMG